MSTTTFYRFCVWLPVAFPALLIVVVRIFGLHDLVGVVGELVAYSLVYGGIPYTVLAVWATWWVGGRTEIEIRRMMFRAPLFMLALFVSLALMVGVIVGAPVPWAGVAALGAAVIVPLGYFYVGLTVLLRSQLGRRVKATDSPASLA